MFTVLCERGEVSIHLIGTTGFDIRAKNERS